MFNFAERNIKKVLIFRFGAIGDVVHSTSLYRALKKYDPGLSVHYLTFKTPGELLKNDPDLEKLWIAEGKSYKYLIKLAKILRQEKYDVCINLQPSIRTKFFSLISGAKIRLVYKKTFKLHAVENFWRTAKPVFKDIILPDRLKLYLSEEAKLNVSCLIDENKPVIGLNIGANQARQGRKWPLDYWKKLAGMILEKYNCEIILTGSEEDAPLAESLTDLFPDIKSFCGKLSIAESAALLSKCNLVISGDTGPLHIATAFKVPVIGLYGSMPVSRTGPYGKNNFVLFSDRDCVPCNRRKCRYLEDGELYTPCMIDVTPDKVLEIINSYLK